MVRPVFIAHVARHHDPYAMIAALQRAIVVGVLLVVGSTTFVLHTFDHTGWAIVFFVSSMLVHPSFLGVEFVLLRWATRKLPLQRPEALAIVRAWAGETAQALRVFCWRQPFRANAHPDVLPSVPSGHRGVVLVHGLLCNRGFWNPWLAEFERGSTAFIAVDLEPVFCSIDKNIDAVERAVARLTVATGRSPMLVGHSRGGLVIRAWLAAQRAQDRAHHLITIGTPHRGTWLARFARSPSAREMQIGSQWLAHLEQRENPASATRFTCFFSRSDNIVFTADRACLARADNREILASAHVQMAFDKQVFDEVKRRLSADE